VANGRFIISADTGLIHVADVYGTPGIMLTGPTAFGGTTFPQISILKADLDCMPCTKDGRGSCSAPTYQKCMLEITPEMVAKKVKERLSKLD
jgi:heptosyltransferase-2